MCLGTFTKERKLHRNIKKKFKRNNKQRFIILQILDVQVFLSSLKMKKKIVSPSFFKRSADKKGKH